MSDVFISYDKSNMELASRVAKDLEAKGFSVWWDRNIGPGQVFTDVIRHELEAAKAVIVIWTPQSILSRWVQAEALHADNERKLIPLRVADVEPHKIPMPFGLLQTPLVGDITAVVGALHLIGVRPGAASESRASAGSADAAISPEEKLYKEVEADGTVESYEYYLTRYPKGAHSALAEFRLHKLKKAKPDASAQPAMGDSIAASRPASVITVLVSAANKEMEFDLSAKQPQLFRDDDLAPQMVLVPPGQFDLGSPESEAGRDTNEQPRKKIRMADPFAIGRYAVTFDEWTAFASDGGLSGYAPDDKGWGRGRRPVINVSWLDAQAYVAWLAKRTGKPYRLPTEAEWEYAARAGTSSPFCYGDTITAEQANYDSSKSYGNGPTGNSRRQTLPVGSLLPNAFGLYDVHGNVREWVQDIWVANYEERPEHGGAVPGSDMAAAATAMHHRRVVRGGSWYDVPNQLRSAARDRNMPDLRNFNTGFRVARTLD